MASEQFTNKTINIAFGFGLFGGLFSLISGIFLSGSAHSQGLWGIVIPIIILICACGLKLKKSRICAVLLALIYYSVIITIMLKNPEPSDIGTPLNFGRIVFGIPFILAIIGTFLYRRVYPKKR